MTESIVGRGAGYLYVETLTTLLSGYIFWLVVSRLTSTDVVGTASTLISIATICTTLVALGIPTGIQGFLGRSFSARTLSETRNFVFASLLLTSLAIAGCSIVLLFSADWFFKSFSIDYLLLGLIILLTASSAISILFRAIIISSLRTKTLPQITIISAIARLSLAVVFVLSGPDLIAIVAGFASLPLISSVLMSIVLVRLLRQEQHEKEKRTTHNTSKMLLVASLVTWIPGVISTLGSQLGTIVIFGAHGPSPAGVYFISFLLYTAIAAVSSILLVIGYPLLSAMDDGRKRLAWKIIRMSLVVGIPFSTSVIFYSSDVLQLMGSNYVEGNYSLQILLLSMLPSIIVSGVTYLSYSYKNYRQVFILGIASNVVRTILYFVLIPITGDIGAAISFTIGSAMGFAAAILVALQIGLKMNWQQLVIVSVIPAGIAFVLSYSGLNYVAGILITIAISYLAFIKLDILIRSDVESSLQMLPDRVSKPLSKVVQVLFDKLKGPKQTSSP